MIVARLSVFQKGLILVGLPILSQLGFIALLVQAERNATDAERWALHTKDVLAQAEVTFRLLLQNLTESRAALLDDARIGVPKNDDDQYIESEISKLRALVTDNPPQVVRVDHYLATARWLLAWTNELRKRVHERHREDAISLAKTAEAESIVSGLQAELDAFLAEEHRLDGDRLARAAAARRHSNWLLSGAGIGSISLAIILLWLFTTSIAARLRTVAGNAALLATKQPLQTLVGGADEIAQVDRAFHEAASRLTAADEAEHRYRNELERRAAELTRVNQDLFVKTRENETFVYSVSHDLRSPLVNLQGFGKELASSCQELRATAEDPGVPPKVRQRLTTLVDGDIAESVRYIQTAVSRAGNIIAALLRLSRAGRVEYKMQTVNCRAIVEQVIHAMNATLEQRRAQVRVAQTLPVCWGDPTAIEQIFANLIGNAVNYLDPGRPGHVEISAVPAAPRADGVAVNRQVHYLVKDNGTGIPAAYLPKIFVAFQRLHGDLAPGEGIGLAMVRRMVDRHGGDISVESVEGVGTTFHLFLPAEQGMANPAPDATHDKDGPISLSA